MRLLHQLRKDACRHTTHAALYGTAQQAEAHQNHSQPQGVLWQTWYLSQLPADVPSAACVAWDAKQL
jgi:hypothetical protein